MLAAEIEHLLGLGDTADKRTGQAAASEDEAEGRDWQGFIGYADQGDVAVACEEVDVGIDVVPGGDAVEDEVEAARVLRHFVSVAGDDDLVRAEAERRPASCSARW